jgi:hypothetical protein
MMRHLKSSHNIEKPESAPVQRVQERSSRILDLFAKQVEDEPERLIRQRNKLLETSLDETLLRQLYVRWIVTEDMPFSQVKSPAFRLLLNYINPVADAKLRDSHNTINSWIMWAYEDEKDQIQQNLHSALSSIHFTLDMWSSTNHLSLLGVVAHYTDENGIL